MDPGDLVLRGGRVFDPGAQRPVDLAADIRIAHGRIVEIGRGLVAPRIIDVKDLWIVPGLIDLHVHLREPGQEYKEDIETGTRAAASGGFTTICCMPNTRPVNDQRAVTELIVRRALEVGAVRVRPIGAITHNLEGKQLADIAEMKEAGIVAISDDGRPVMNSGLMRRAFEYARTFDLPVVQHAEDLDLSEGGAMNEGAVSTRIGIRGQPACAESAMVARDLEIVEWTGARYHVAHVSTAAAIAAIRGAKAAGLPVTCDTAPPYFVLNETAIGDYRTFAKLSPPLRCEADRRAVVEGLRDATIDAIASDHAPWDQDSKRLPFSSASSGIVGLETLLPLSLELYHNRHMALIDVVARLTINPARILRLEVGRLIPGAPADLVVFDPDAPWRIRTDAFRSKSKNAPFDGRPVEGRVERTIVDGRTIFLRQG